jgi:hypothetical protein
MTKVTRRDLGKFATVALVGAHPSSLPARSDKVQAPAPASTPRAKQLSRY